MASPATASSATTPRVGSSAVTGTDGHASATDFTNTDAMPKHTPDAPASRTLRAPGRRARRLRRTRTVTVAAVPTATPDCSPPDSGRDAPPSPVSSRSPASPAAVSRAPRRPAGVVRRRTVTAAIGRTNTRVRTPSGWTTVRGPKPRAITWRAPPAPFSAAEAHQSPRRSSAARSDGVPAATRSCRTAAAA